MSKFDMRKALPFAGFPLVKTHAKFLKPTRFGDTVVVDSSVSFGRSSFNVEHRLSLTGTLCVECQETRVWVVRDAGGGIKSHPMPPEVRAKFGA
jgi:4-hydroxybenzoyl-CoA thioesterase